MRGVLKSTTSALFSKFSVAGAMVVLAVVVTSGSAGGTVVLDVVTTGSVTKGVVSGFSVKWSGSRTVMVVVLVWWCCSVSTFVVADFCGALVKCSVSGMLVAMSSVSDMVVVVVVVVGVVVLVVGVSGSRIALVVAVGCWWCSGFSCLWCFPGCLLAI